MQFGVPYGKALPITFFLCAKSSWRRLECEISKKHDYQAELFHLICVLAAAAADDGYFGGHLLRRHAIALVVRASSLCLNWLWHVRLAVADFLPPSFSLVSNLYCLLSIEHCVSLPGIPTFLVPPLHFTSRFTHRLPVAPGCNFGVTSLPAHSLAHSHFLPSYLSYAGLNFGAVALVVVGLLCRLAWGLTRHY